MAYVHRETFDILEHIDLETGAEEYFECDEELCGVIALLNKKGYRTKYCCSGHLYDDLTDTFSVEEGEMTDEEILENVPGVQEIIFGKDGVRRVLLRQCVGLRTYILFEPGTAFPFLPVRFRQRGDELSFLYQWDAAEFLGRSASDIQKHPLIFYSVRLQVIRELTAWAEELPEASSLTGAGR